jgi:hypothetical protein
MISVSEQDGIIPSPQQEVVGQAVNAMPKLLRVSANSKRLESGWQASAQLCFNPFDQQVAPACQTWLGLGI